MKYLFIIVAFLHNTLTAQILYVQKSVALPKFISESSGVCKMPDGNFLTFNDSGNSSDIYVLDSIGNYIKTIKLKGANNIDWEAISVCYNMVYLADIGNNINNRNIFELYYFKYNINDTDFNAEKIIFTYKNNIFLTKSQWGHNFDAEAIICLDRNIYLFSKNRTNPYNGICYLYKINTSHISSSLVPIDSIVVGTKGFFSNSITDAAISPSGKTLALITTKKIYLFYDFKEDEFFRGKHAEFTFDKFTQKEGVCFLNEDTIIVTDENHHFIPGGKIYYYEVSSFLNGNKVYRSQEIERVDIKITSNNKSSNDGICEFKILLYDKSK